MKQTFDISINCLQMGTSRHIYKLRMEIFENCSDEMQNILHRCCQTDQRERWVCIDYLSHLLSIATHVGNSSQRIKNKLLSVCLFTPDDYTGPRRRRIFFILIFSLKAISSLSLCYDLTVRSLFTLFLKEMEIEICSTTFFFPKFVITIALAPANRGNFKISENDAII